MRVVTAILVLVLCSASSIVYASDLSDKDITAIMKGKIIVEKSTDSNGVPGLVAAFSVASTRETIWNAFVDYENFTRIFDGIDKLEVLEQDEKGALVEFWVDAVLSDLDYTLYRKYDKPGYKLTWKRTAGDLKVIEGGWEILDSPVDGQYIVVYSSYVEVGRIVPATLVRWGAMRKAEGMCKRLKKWIADAK